jgi:hypothetical protein
MRYQRDATATGPFWQSPAGHICLVKSIILSNIATVSVKFALQMVTGGGALNARAQSWDVAAGKNLMLDMWFVLNPLDGIYIYAEGGAHQVWVSGAVLKGVPLFPPVTQTMLELLPAPFEPQDEAEV